MTSSTGTAAARPPKRAPSFLHLVLLVARRDYLRTVRRRGFVFGTLLLPIGMGILLTISTVFSTSSFQGGVGAGAVVVVVNESGVPLIVDKSLTPNVQLVDRQTALARLQGGSIKEFYVIPTTFPGQPTIQRMESGGRSATLDALQRQSQEQQVLDILLHASLLRQAGVPPQTIVQVLTPLQIVARTVDGQPVSEASVAASFLLPYAFTLIFVMSIFITSGYLLQSVTEEKENRVVEIVLSSVPALPLMAGKILGLGAAGLTQVLIWVSTAVIALPILNERLSADIHVSALTIVLAIVYFTLGYLAFGAIFAAIGALAPGAREAQQYSGFFGFFAVVPLILASAFLADPQSPIVWILALIPLTAPAAMLEVLALSSDPPWLMIAASLTSLIVFVLLAILASARVFRATLLLYGVRPGLRQIVGAVFARS